MTKKIQKGNVWFVLFCSISLLLAGCARNTAGEQYDDGRFYFIIDLNPEWFYSGPQGYVFLRYTVEGEDPVISGPEDYSVVALNGAKLDLAGRSLPGGTEIQVTASVYPVGEDVLTFKIDGNTTVIFRQSDPTNRSSRLTLYIE
ncbi:MAG: hypothetical protein KAJ81_09340 [Candidatus Latescibacteria bacterium]|nr:hypothetical protein [Candidatus Latescibacterota bacterium]